MPFPESVPELTDGVVRLRAHHAEDIERIVEQCQDPETLRWTTVPRPYAAAQAEGFLQIVADGWSSSDGQRYWAITDAGDPLAVFRGTIDLRPKPGGTAELGFGLHPDGRGRGLMTRAVRLVAAHWFDVLGGRRLYWYSDRGNFSSWRVAWACGFTHHGRLPLHNSGVTGLPPGAPDGLARDAWVASLGADDDRTRPVAPWHEPPLLEATGVRLRAWRDDDTATAEPHDHPSHHVPGHAIPTPETFAAWLLRRREVMSQGTSINWCIADPASDEPVGELLVFVHHGSLTDGDTAELGYFVKPTARGRGFATRAARLGAAHALSRDGLGLRRLVAETAADNAASNTVLERAGFTRWGHEAAAPAPDGSVGPADHWEVLRR